LNLKKIKNKKSKWLDKYEKIPLCTCGLIEKIGEVMEEDKAHQFMMGLDDDPCSAVRSHANSCYGPIALNGEIF